MKKPDKVRAPFTADQVASLNAYQESRHAHPYTCGSEACPSRNWADESLPLAAFEDGLICVEGMGCTYTQDWAHAWTADWSWRRRESRNRRQHRRRARRSLRKFRKVLRRLPREDAA